MPILQLPPNPSRNKDQDQGRPGEASGDGASNQPANQPLKLRTGRFGDLEEHELIHLIDSLDDERSRARFRESVYISVIIWIVIGWFLFYGPRVLFHQPEYRDPIAMMKQHDKEQLTYLNPPAPRAPKPPRVLNQKTIQQIQKQAREAPPAPQPPAQQAPPPPQEQAHNITPPVPQPATPLPAAPRPASSENLPSAPHPNFAQNSQSAHGAIQDAMRGALRGRSGADVGGPGSGAGPLQAGTTILSDIGDWDPSAYMRKLHNDIQRNWDPLIPEEVQPPLMKKGMVGIRFVILRGGEIGDIKLETASGDVSLDKAAWYAITSEGQFPPLPKDYHGQQLELRVGFFYNEPIR
jgi:TonB family protein